MKRTISSRESKWWAVFSSTDKYDEGRLDYDVRLLRQFYLARGYADVDVSRVQGGLLRGIDRFCCIVHFEEGARYRVNGVEINSEIENIDVEALGANFDFGDDNWYDVRLLEQGMLDVTNQLGSFTPLLT